MTILPYKRVAALLTAAGLFFVLSVASADPIGPDDCDSCDGGQYTLFYSGSPISTNNVTGDVFRITFELDTTGVAAATPGAVALDSASIKIPNSTAVSLFGAPGGTSDWNLIAGGINAGGCDPNPNNGFYCADWIVPNTVGTNIGGILFFIFDVTVPHLSTPSLSDSIKGRFVNSSGGKVGDLLSEEIGLQQVSSSSGGNDTSSGGSHDVPEPNSSVLSLIGVILLGGTLWRRRSQRS